MSSTKQAVWVVVGMLAFLGLMYFVVRPPSDGIQIVPGPAAPAAAPVPAAKRARTAQDDARLEECRAMLKIAAEGGILHNMTFDDGRPKVWVTSVWQRMTIEQKTGLAKTAACFFLAGEDGPGGNAITFPIYDNLTGKEIATWRFTRLEIE